jgi:RND family efflux transporter MFP subunit
MAAPVAVLAAGFVIVQVLADARPRPEQAEEEQRLVSLYVDQVEAETVQVSVRTQGEVRPKTEIDVVPQVSGRIVAISESFNDGAAFRAGDLLVKIDDTDYQLALVRAESRVAAARTELERQLATQDIKEQEWADNRSRGEKPTDFALNKTQVAEARAALRSAEADLRQARLDLERTEIRVPFDGHVRQRSVGIGQFVAAGMPLGRVFSSDTVEVRLPLTDTQLAELNLPLGYAAGDAEPAPAVHFSIRLGNRDYEWLGRLVRVSAAVDEDTRLIYATAELRDPYGLGSSEGMPMAVGLFVNARIGAISEQQAMVMPRLALRAEDQVYVINEKNRLEIRTVDVLATSEERVVVASGVNPGDQVVTSTLPNAVDGMEVEPIRRAGAASDLRNG